MRSLLYALLAAAFLSGCQTADDALDSTTAPAAISSPAASAIAGDMASRLAEQLGSAGTTTIAMEDGTSEFAIALEAALKGWGYTVVTDGKIEKGAKPIALSYSIESFDGQILARLTIPSLALSRAYSATPAGATPASPLSIMQRI
jgi:hypothetical protein